MFVEDRVVELVTRLAAERPDLERELVALAHATHLVVDTPTERILEAVKHELRHQCAEGRRQVIEAWLLSQREGRPPKSTEEAYTRAVSALHPGTCRFPRAAVEALLAELALPDRDSPELRRLAEVLERANSKHVAFEERVGRLMRPPTFEEVQAMDPVRDCNAIHHYLTYAFRTEREFFGSLAEMRPLIAPSANVFFFGTGEFELRAYRRLWDTVLLFDNFSNWGPDSRRGRQAMERINGIHGRYNIPNDAFKWVLANTIFVAVAWNRRVGWRPWTDVERLGWFNLVLTFGREMHLADLPEDYDEFEAWWMAFDAACPPAAEITRDSFERFLAQLVSARPAVARDAVTTAMIVGMDDAFRRCLGYDEPPAEVLEKVRGAFRTAGTLAGMLPSQPWIRSLQSSPLYPHGAEVDEIGVQRRGYHMPTLPRHLDVRDDAEIPPLVANRNDGRPEHLGPITSLDQIADPDLPVITRAEVAKHDRADDGWMVIDGFVYDVGTFLVIHPGGQRVLRPWLGKDGSRPFGKVGHSAAAQVLMTNFRIGRVAAEDAT